LLINAVLAASQVVEPTGEIPRPTAAAFG